MFFSQAVKMHVKTYSATLTAFDVPVILKSNFILFKNLNLHYHNQRHDETTIFNFDN